MQQIHLVEGFSPMLKYYVKTTEAVKRLRADIKGVVSFEYVIVAACVVVAVLFAFGPTGSGVIGQALSNGIAAIVSKVPTS
jgi:pilus assembly protein Flp/PilA